MAEGFDGLTGHSAPTYDASSIREEVSYVGAECFHRLVWLFGVLILCMHVFATGWFGCLVF